MQRRTSSSRFTDRALSDADLRRIQRWLRWMTMASVVAFVALSAEGAKWWAVRASWTFVVMLALRRQSRQAIGDAYDEIIASRKRRSE
jgi:hypothetical protein